MKSISLLSPRILKLSLAILVLAAAASPVLAAGPSVVGLWRFNEGSGTTAADSSGLGNNGTLQGTNGFPQWVPSKPGLGDALAFTNDGVNYSYVSVPGSPSLMIGLTATDTWSLTLWAYESSSGTGDFVSTYGRMLVLDNGYAFQWESGASGDDTAYTWSRANDAWQVGWGAPTAPLLDQWEHWAVVYDGTNLNVYLNGNQGPNGAANSVPVMAALGYAGYQGAVLIGTELAQTPDRNWNGMLDDVALFSGALTQAQIDTVMSGDFSQFSGGPAHILTPPANATSGQGSTVTFTVGAAGESPISYQWFEGATPIANATNSSLVLTNVQKAQDGSYSVTVSNSLGGQTSQPVTLSVFNTPLVALWRFNEPGGSNVYDSSGLGNNGVFEGENGNYPGRLPSMPGFGSALSLTNDGVDHAYVAVPANGSLEIGQTATNPWSITAWAYESSDGTGDFVANYGRILVIDDGTALQLESGASGDGEFYTWSRAYTQWQIGWGVGDSVSPLLDQWEHWAVVYDGTNLTVYRDGNEGTNGGVASQAVFAALGYAGYDGAVNIGSEVGATGDRTWNGLLDDIAIFNVPLTQSQIQLIMTGNFSQFIAPPALTIQLSGGNLTISWPVSDGSFQLQSSATLLNPDWTSVTTTPASNGNTLSVTVPLGAHAQYFRLIGQ